MKRDASTETIGRFALGTCLASGPISVYEATDLDLGRPLILKVMAAPSEGDERSTATAAALLEEARLAAAVDHPRVAKVYEHGRIDGLVYLAIERIRGQTLERLAQAGPLPIGRGVALARELAQALVAVHEQGLVHCDLSPSNVVVKPDGHAVLLDFGLGRRLAEANRAPASIAGTPGFLAPEQILCRPLTPQTDVFALGALLYWLLTGEVPFTGTDRATALAATLDGRPTPLARLRRGIPIDLERVVAQALATDPADRFRTMDALCRALQVLERSLDPSPAETARTSADGPAPDSDAPAFRGLLPFGESDRERFFGRDRDIATLVDRVERPDRRLIVLIGESGAGKSSLLRAGVLPVLRERGCLPIYIHGYDDDPESELRAELERQTLLEPAAVESTHDFVSRVARTLGASIVLVLDQLESLLNEIPPPSPRASFLRFLAACHADRALPLTIVISIRQDFLYRLIELEQEPGGWIPQPLALDNVHTVRRLERKQAQAVLERTCAAGALTVEPALLRDLARDLAAAGSVLPFELQIVGTELERRGILDRAGYRRAGGKTALVDGFLDEVIQGSGDREGASRLLLSLVAEDGTRRQLSRSEIEAATRLEPERVARLLERFASARLLAIDQRGDPWRYSLVHDQLAAHMHGLAGQLADARDRANRLLRQYVASHRVDPTTAIPLTRLWSIWRHGDPPVEEGRALVRRSLVRGLARGAAIAAGVALATLAIAAPFSITQAWDATVLRDGHHAAAKAAVLSPDGQRLATGGEDGRLILWDLDSRLPTVAVQDHGGWVHDAAFSPDGRTLASIGADLRVVLRDAASLEPRRWLPVRVGPLDHQPQYARIAYSPHGRYLAAWISGVGTRVWRTRDLEELAPAADGNIGGDPLFSPDDRWLVSANGTAWDVEEGRPVATSFPDDLAGNYAALSRDSSLLAVVGTFGVVSVLDVSRFWTGGRRRWVAQHHAHRDHGRSVAFSRDDGWIATAADDICLFDGSGRQLRARLPYAAIVWDLVFGHQGDRLISTHGDGAVLIWDVDDHRIEARLGNHGAAVRGVAFAPGGQRLATASEDRTILLWNLASRRIDGVLQGHGTRINAVVFANDGTLYSADQNGDVIRWHRERRAPRWRTQLRWGEHDMPSPVYALAASPDGRFVAVSTGVIDAASGDLVVDFATYRRRTLHGSRIYGMRFTPAGRYLAIATTDGTVLLLRTTDWQVVASSSAGDVTLVALDVSPDGRHLVTGENEGAVRLWSIEPLAPIAVLGEHTSRVKSVAFSPDGRLVASAGDDRRLVLWDPKRRRPGREISTSAAPVLSVAFSPDGAWLASGGHDGSTRLFERQDRLWGWRLP